MDLNQLLYNLDNDENCLKHYGRKGMRWGENIFTKKTPQQLAKKAEAKKKKKLEKDEAKERKYQEKQRKKADKLEYRKKLAETKAKEAQTRYLEADARNREAQASSIETANKKVKDETKNKIKMDKKAAEFERNRIKKKDKDAAKLALKKEEMAIKEERRKQESARSQQTSTKYSHKDYKNMTDEELRNVLNRLNNEAMFKKYYKSPGAKAISTISSAANTAGYVWNIANSLGLSKEISKRMKTEGKVDINKLLNSLSALGQNGSGGNGKKKK